jgi:hypothetical protein
VTSDERSRLEAKLSGYRLSAMYAAARTRHSSLVTKYMRFPAIDQLNMPCTYTAYHAGRLHPDGRRYLPLIVLQPDAASDMATSVTPAEFLLGVVDRHHRVAQDGVGMHGSAQLVCALSALQIQRGPYQAGFMPEVGWRTGQPSTMPTVYGRVAEVISWEAERERLAYEALYTELLIDTGHGLLGLRTSATASSLAEQIGKARIEVGDAVVLQRSRIDILGWAIGR